MIVVILLHFNLLKIITISLLLSSIITYVIMRVDVIVIVNVIVIMFVMVFYYYYYYYYLFIQLLI
jgi:hypothetical protein